MHYDQNKEKMKENYQKRNKDNSLIPCAIKEEELKNQKNLQQQTEKKYQIKYYQENKNAKKEYGKSIMKQTKKPKKNTGGIIMR